jgi:hypothetical protein
MAQDGTRWSLPRQEPSGGHRAADSGRFGGRDLGSMSSAALCGGTRPHVVRTSETPNAVTRCVAKTLTSERFRRAAHDTLSRDQAARSISGGRSLLTSHLRGARSSGALPRRSWHLTQISRRAGWYCHNPGSGVDGDGATR